MSALFARRPRLVVSGIGVIALLAACRGSAGAPDHFQIARLVQNAAQFQRPRTVEVTTTYDGPCETALRATGNWRQFSELGIVNLVPGPGGRCHASLTEEARREVSALSGGDPARPGRVSLPVATRTFLRVLEVASEPHSAAVRFLWQWQPTALGRKLGLPADAREGHATLWLYDTGWRLSGLELGEKP